MLTKLLKYEYKATGRIFLPLYAVLLVFAAINKILLNLNTSRFELPQGISMFLYVAMIIAIFVITVVVTIQRFYRNLLSDEGYLMFTLPVKTWQHIVSKLLVSVSWVILSVIIAFGSIFIVAYERGLFGDIASELSLLLDTVDAYLGSGHLAILSTELIAGILISLFASSLMLYAAIAVGHMAPNHKLLVSFGAFLGLNTVTQIIVGIISFYTLPGTIEFISSVEEPLIPANLESLLLVYLILIPLVFGAAFYALTTFILNKKLNLE